MPDDINTRMHYFDRQFLRASDFQVEQKYHLERHRLHNKLLHTAGVAAESHLVVSQIGQATLKVAAGIAIDDEGREIVLLQEYKHTIPLETKPGKYELIVRLDEVPDDPSTDPGVNGPTRIREKPIFELLTPSEVKPPMLRLAEIEVEPDGMLKSPPTSIRTFAGTLVGASTTFDTVTASTLALKADGIDPAKRPDLSCNASGDIRFRTTRPAKSSPEETLLITSTGFVKSPMWNVTQLYKNQRAPGAPIEPEKEIALGPDTFKTGGGTLLILASGSGASKAPVGQNQSITIGMDLFLDDVFIGKVQSCVNNQDFQPFVSTFLVVPKIAPGTHKLKLKTSTTTIVGRNDFFDVTILELPFQ